MQKERAIAMLDETLARYRTVEPDDLDAIADEIKGLGNTAKGQAMRVRLLEVKRSNNEEQADICEELDAIHGWSDDLARELGKLADRLRAR